MLVDMLSIFLGAFVLAQIVVGHSTCTKPRVRKSWRALSNGEKGDYIEAVKCLQNSKPQGTKWFPNKSRYDDFVSVHINATGAALFDANGNFMGLGGPWPGIHLNGQFLPWHRYFLWNYETALRNECHYSGYQPYWDWSLDTTDEGGSWASSPVFDPKTGFGGNGINGTIVNITPFMKGSPKGGIGEPLGSCVVTGPFAQDKYTLNLDFGPPKIVGTLPTAKRCLYRNWQPQITDIGLGWDKNVKPILELFPFANFTAALDQDAGGTGAPGLHPSGHGGTGGEMLNIWSSTNDPLFFLHHANLDRIWHIWQKKHNITYDIGGPLWANGTGLTTFDTLLDMGVFLAPAIPARSVMDMLNRDNEGFLCYKYLEDVPRDY